MLNPKSLLMCSWHLECVWMGECDRCCKALWVVSRLEKHFVDPSPFTICCLLWEHYSLQYSYIISWSLLSVNYFFFISSIICKEKVKNHIHNKRPTASAVIPTIMCLTACILLKVDCKSLGRSAGLQKEPEPLWSFLLLYVAITDAQMPGDHSAQ